MDHDAADSPESLPARMHLQWVRQLPEAKAAWPETQKKLQFDRCYEPVIMGKTIFVPSMVGDHVAAFDTETGGTAMVEIFDITGLKVMSTPKFEARFKTEYTVDITGLASGLYVCRLYIEGGGGGSSESFKLAVRR